MLKRLSLDKGKKKRKKKKEVANVSLLNKKYSYFVGNILIEVRVVFLPDCPLILSLLKHRDVGAF